MVMGKSTKKAGVRCLRVEAGDKPISMDEWNNAPELKDIYKQYDGCLRCVCAKLDDAKSWKNSDADRETMTQKCEKAKLVHKVGHKIFGTYDLKNVRRASDQQETANPFGSLNGNLHHKLEDTMKRGFTDLEGVLSGINTYNLKQLGIAAVVGGIGALGMNWLNGKIAAQEIQAEDSTQKTFWGLLNTFGPLLALGGLGLYVMDKNPNMALALATAGGVLTLSKVKEKYMDDSLQKQKDFIQTGIDATTSPTPDPLSASNDGTVKGLFGYDVLPKGLSALLPTGGFNTQEEASWADSPEGLSGNVLVPADFNRQAVGSWIG